MQLRQHVIFFSPMSLQYGPVQWGLVTINTTGMCYRPACNYYPVTCDATRLIQWLQEIRFEGGLMEQCIRLSEGFAGALELADLMESSREPWLVRWLVGWLVSW